MPGPTGPHRSATAARTALAVVASALAGCVAASDPRDAAAERKRGRALAAMHQCTACHRIDGVAGGRGDLAPALHDYGRRETIAGRVPNTRAALAQWIVDPPSLVPDTAMPRLGVTPADAAAIAAFLHAPG